MTRPFRVVLATSNAGKLREFEALGERAGWQFVLPDSYEAPIEDGATYADNAAIKAKTLWRTFDRAGTPVDVIADDSGLEVRALGGRPGVWSARFVSETATWRERRDALLAELAADQSGDRSARFVCALHFIGARGEERTSLGTYDGSIVTQERGSAGFSYDPIFLDPLTGRTFGELTEEEKNAKSHRARAFGALLATWSG